MKKSKFLIVFILIFTVLGSACGAKTPAPTSKPPATPTQKPPVQNIASPTPIPEALTERLGHVWVYEVNTLAGYVVRSFLQIPVGMTWGPDGYLYIADWAGRHIVRVAADGTMDDLPFWRTVMPLQYDGPRGVVFDSQGNLFTNNHGKIFRIDSSGNVSELQGVQGSPIGSLAISPADELYYTDRAQQGGALRKWDPAGRSETILADLPFAENMVFGLDGSLYLTQMAQPQILKIDVGTGTGTTFQEDACGNDPCFLAVDREGDIWARGINRLTQFTPDGVVKPFIVDGEEFGGFNYWHTAAGIAFDEEGGLWIASYNSWLKRLAPLTPGAADPEFTLQTIAPGMEVTDLDVDQEGNIYAPDMNSMRVLRFKTDGETEVLLDHGFGGRTAVALGADGLVYIGLPTGQIVRLEADGSSSHYASLLTRRMVFGVDGALYAIVGDYGQAKSIVRITGVDTFTTLAAEIDGISLGFGDAHISPALDTGFYVFTEQERNLFLVDYDGQGTLIANLRDLGGGGPVVMAASPVTGDIYFIPHGPYKVFRIDAEGKSQEVVSGVDGDPWGMVVSKDGNWLYVAESGVIDRIPISK